MYACNHWRTIQRIYIHSLMQSISQSFHTPFLQGYLETRHSFSHAWGSSSRLVALRRGIRVSGVWGQRHLTEAVMGWDKKTWGQISVMPLNSHILTMLQETRTRWDLRKISHMPVDLSTLLCFNIWNPEFRYLIVDPVWCTKASNIWCNDLTHRVELNLIILMSSVTDNLYGSHKFPGSDTERLSTENRFANFYAGMWPCQTWPQTEDWHKQNVLGWIPAGVPEIVLCKRFAPKIFQNVTCAGCIWLQAML